MDEVHNAFLSDNYRPSMQALRHLELAGVPKIFLTATLLPEHEPVLADWLGIPAGARRLVLRSPTARANHSIQVAPIDPSSQDVIDIGVRMARLLLTSWEQERSVRGVVFVKSLLDLGLFRSSADFDVCTYHGRMPEEEKERQLRTWLSNSNVPTPKWIVATTALLHGVDYPRVDAVIFLGRPYGLYDFVQGAGRAGRSGQKSLVAIIFPPSGPQKQVNGNKFACQEGVQKTLKSSTCRRAIISEFMDGEITTCATLPGSELCDICGGGLHPIVQQAIVASTPASASKTLLGDSDQQPRPAAVIGAELHTRSPPVASSAALFNGKAAQAAYKSRYDHGVYMKELISKLSGCFTCRIYDPKHKPCHDPCANSGATSCSKSSHKPFSCTPFPHKTGWMEFRKSLPWKKDVYRCYFCGLPNSVVSNGEHRSDVPNGSKCRYSDSALTACWHVLKTPHLLEGVKRELGFNPGSGENLERSFAAWLVEYGSATEEIRLFVVFHWLCKHFYSTHSG